MAKDSKQQTLEDIHRRPAWPFGWRQGLPALIAPRAATRQIGRFEDGPVHELDFAVHARKKDLMRCR
jgi:hypothetical protein